MPELTGPISGGCIEGGFIVGTLLGVSGEAVIHAGSAPEGPHGAEASELGQAVTSRTR